MGWSFDYGLLSGCMCVLLGKNILYTGDSLFLLSNGPDKKERTKFNEHIGMHKGAIFNFGSTACTLLIGLNIKFYEIFTKQPVNPLFSNKLPYDKISSESK